jgi:peroxiredoxin
MPKVELDCPAPDFTLHDFRGKPVRLADFRGKQHVVLVFNRGFT